jgi:hypothetical protein
MKDRTPSAREDTVGGIPPVSVVAVPCESLTPGTAAQRGCEMRFWSQAFAVILLAAGGWSSAQAETWDGNITWAGNGTNGVNVKALKCVTSPVISGQYIDWNVTVSGQVNGPVTVFLYYQRLCYYKPGGHQATHDVMIGYAKLDSLAGARVVQLRGVAPFQCQWERVPSGDVFYIVKTKSPQGYAYGNHRKVKQLPPLCGLTGGEPGSTGAQPNPMSYGPDGLSENCKFTGPSTKVLSAPKTVASGQFVDVVAKVNGVSDGPVIVGLYCQRLTDHGIGHRATQDILIGYQFLPKLNGGEVVRLRGASPFEVGWDELPTGTVHYMVNVSTKERYLGLTAPAPRGEQINPWYGGSWKIKQTEPTSGVSGGNPDGTMPSKKRPARPRITVHTKGQEVDQGESVTFTVEASGEPEPTFQWQKDGRDIPEATGSSYTVAATKEVDGAGFRCVAANKRGQARSRPARLRVRPKGPDPATLQEWEARLLTRLRDSLKGGKRPALSPGSVRKRREVLSINSEDTLVVEAGSGLEVGMRLSRLSADDRANLALSVVREGSAEDHCLAAFFMLAAGRDEDAEDHLDAGGEGAEAVRAVFR